MQEEKQNKNIREKLETIEHLPEGISFGASAAWQQLEKKLQPQQKNEKYWYYIAAVLLFLVCGIGSLLIIDTNKKQQQVISSPTKAIQPIINNDQPPKSTVAVHQTNTIIAPAKIFQKSVTAIPQDNLPATASKISAKDEVLIPIEKKSAAEVKEQHTDTTPVRFIASNTMESNTKIKTVKKLTVVHINELDPITPEPVILTKSEIKKLMQRQDENENNISETPRYWWQAKPKPVPNSLTDNQ